MYISLLTQSLYSQGAEYVVAAMARGFAAAGHRVDVVVSAYHAECEATIKDRKPFDIGEKARLVRLPGRRARQNIFSLRRYIKNDHPDVILCNAEPFMPALAMANRLLPKSKRCKIVHVEHLSGMGLDDTGNLWTPPLTLRRRVERVLLNCYDGVFVVSTGTGEAMHRLFGYPTDRIFTVFNPALDEVAVKKMLCDPAHPWLKDKMFPTFVAGVVFCAGLIIDLSRRFLVGGGRCLIMRYGSVLFRKSPPPPPHTHTHTYVKIDERFRLYYEAA